MYALRWENFTETIFGGVGKSSRQWLVSLAVGLDALFAETPADRRTSTYYANPYMSIQEAQRKYFAVSSFAFYPAEYLVVEFLEDDRHFRRRDELTQGIHTEADFVASIPESTFAEVAIASGLQHETGATLKQEIMHSLHVSLSYIYMEGLIEAMKEPRGLTQGDVADNVRKTAVGRVASGYAPGYSYARFSADTGRPCHHRVVGEGPWAGGAAGATAQGAHT